MSEIRPSDPLNVPEPHELGDGYRLEPVTPHDAPPRLGAGPVVRDARGQLWRARPKRVLDRLLSLQAVSRAFARLLDSP